MSRAGNLLRYSATRLALAPVMLWLIATLVFLLLRVAPGDPVDAVLGSRAPAEVKAKMREQLGLDQSLLHQYLDYLQGLLPVHVERTPDVSDIEGLRNLSWISLDLRTPWDGQHLFWGIGSDLIDLGRSLLNEETVLSIIGRTLPASLELSVIALVMAAVIGLSIGFTGIARPEGKLDFAGRLYGLGTYALPPFWIAMLVQLLFAVVLGWLPVGGRFPPSLIPPDGSGFYLFDCIKSGDWGGLRGTVRHLILPASTLALLLSGTFTTALRLNLRRTLRSDYVEAARSRGLSEPTGGSPPWTAQCPASRPDHCWHHGGFADRWSTLDRSDLLLAGNRPAAPGSDQSTGLPRRAGNRRGDCRIGRTGQCHGGSDGGGPRRRCATEDP